MKRLAALVQLLLAAGRHLWRRLGLLFGCLYLLRGPMIAFALGLAISLPSQIDDAFRIDAADLPLIFSERFAEVFGPYAFTVVTIPTTALLIYLFARLVTLAPAVDRPEPVSADDDAIRHEILLALPIFLAAFYLLYYLHHIASSFAPRALPYGAFVSGFLVAAIVVVTLVLALFVFGVADPASRPFDRVFVRLLFWPKVEPALDHGLARVADRPQPAPTGLTAPTEGMRLPPAIPVDPIAARQFLMLVGRLSARYLDVLISLWQRLALWSSGGQRSKFAERYCIDAQAAAPRPRPAGAPGPTSASFAKAPTPTLPAGVTPSLKQTLAQLVEANFGVLLVIAAKYALVALLLLAGPVVALLSAVALFLPVLPIRLPQAIGTIAIAQLFVVVVLVVASLPRLRPLAIGWLVLTLLLSCTDANDSHYVHQLPGAPPPQPGLAEAFGRWIDERADATQTAGGSRYPVYIVAARGGGIYAAYHTAMFLARMQDRCSSFAPHLFAISSVSGGSVGAAMFTALAQEQARNNRDAGCHLPDQPDSRMSGALETRTRRILSEDLLSPTVSRFLFADVLLQAVPNCLRHLWCVTGFDRARALEASFEEAFAKHAPPDAANPFTHSVYRQWKADAAAPALLINTTEVETGERVVIAPFAPAVGAGTGLRGTLLERAPGLDLRLSTAAAISARFPLISPAASYELGRDSPTGRKRRLVDGGYADNSGIATALDLIEVIAAEARRRRLPVDIRLIALTGVPHDEEPARGFGEIASPMRALFNVRDEQGRRIEELAMRTLSGERDGVSAAIWYARLDATALKLPLGWRLSERSRAAIDAQLGWPAAGCDASRVGGGVAAAAAARNTVEANACTLQAIYHDLAHAVR